MPKIHWKRSLFRMWAVVSGFWIVIVSLMMRPDHYVTFHLGMAEIEAQLPDGTVLVFPSNIKYETMRQAIERLLKGKPEFATNGPRNLLRDELASENIKIVIEQATQKIRTKQISRFKLFQQDLIVFLILAPLIPAGLLGSAYTLGWIIRGFLSSSDRKTTGPPASEPVR